MAVTYKWLPKGKWLYKIQYWSYGRQWFWKMIARNGKAVCYNNGFDSKKIVLAACRRMKDMNVHRDFIVIEEVRNEIFRGD